MSYYPKPLKGETIVSNYGSFDTISATTLILDQTAVAGLVEGAFFDGVTIINSNIYNTVIGVDGPQAGYFTQLNTFSDVVFYGSGRDEAIYWNVDEATFYITSSANFKVAGCAQLGNLEICDNDISAMNTNGDIRLKPNGFGTIYFDGPIYNVTSIGDYLSEYKNGGMTFNVKNNISLNSSSGSLDIKTFDNQNFVTKNGDFIINVDSNVTNANLITTIQSSSGNIQITTLLPSYLKSGDTITISDNSEWNGTYTVDSILNNTNFKITSTTGSEFIGTGGSFIKAPSNDIILNTQHYVKIPTDTELVFGPTCNSISGNTSAMTIHSCNDLYLDVNSSNIIRIPEQTKLQFGTSGSNYINYTSSSLNINSAENVTINSKTLQIKSTNTSFYDPILTIGDYTTVTNDNKDRGIEFRYFDTSSNSMKLGWMGYKNSTGKYTFYKNATNTNEIITGTLADLELKTISIDTISVNPGGSINMNCGSLLSVSQLTGCNGTITISGSSNVNIEANNRIYLNSTNDILIPNNILLKFGTNGSYIRETTNSNLQLSGLSNIRLSTASKGSIIVPIETQISFDGSTNGTSKISSNTSGDLLINTNKDLYLITTGGNVKIPTNTNIHFGGSNQSVYGNTSGLYISSVSTSSSLILISNSNVAISSSTGNILLQANTGDINLITTLGNVRIPATKNLVFSLSGTDNSISLNSQSNLVVTGNTANNFQLTRFNNVNLLASNGVYIPTNTRLNLSTDGSKYIYSDTNDIYIKNNQGIGNIKLESNSSIITSSGSFYVNGSFASFNVDNFLTKDLNITIGDNTLLLDDNKDRGIEFRYFDTISNSMKYGWFGYKNTTDRFTYYSNSINTNDIISGTLGSFEVGSVYINENIVFNSSGSINLNCGSLLNVNTISGCTGVLNINGRSTVNISGTNTNINSDNINLTANTKVLLPYNIPLSFGNTSNSLNCDTSGNLNLNATKFVINSDVQINGTTTTIYSTVTNIQDPIISIGGVTGPLIDDNKDRGIEFKWNDGTSSKTGFFGFKDNLQRFVFIKDGVNTNEVFNGFFSDVQFGNGYFTNLNLSNGNISGINELSGGTITIKTTSGNINLTPTNGSSVLLPYNTPLSFGNTTNNINCDTNGNLSIITRKDITLASSIGSIILDSSSDVRIKKDVPLYFGADNNTYIYNNTNGNLVIMNSDGNINLTPQVSSGSVIIPANNLLIFGNTSNSIYSDNSQLYLNGYNGVNINSSTVTFAGNINILGDLSNDTYILPLGKSQNLTITDIRNLSSTSGNIKITTSEDNYLTIGDKVTLSITNSIPAINKEYTVTGIVNNKEFIINDPLVTFTTNGTSGFIKSILKTNQNKDVGIQINYWKDTLNNGITAGSINYRNGFFGYKYSTDRWVFYNEATINNYVVTGTLGNIEVNKLFANKIDGFILEGSITAGSNAIVGTNFRIGGGEINGTEIGRLSAAPGRFTNLSSTVLSSFADVQLNNSLNYSIERYTLNGSFLNRNPTITKIVSLFKVTGVGNNSTSGTMPSLITNPEIVDGTYKVLTCMEMGQGCQHTVFFGTGKLIAPTVTGNSPTKIIFKRAGQSAQVLYSRVDDTWILLNSGAYVE